MTSEDFKAYTSWALAAWNVALTLAIWLRKPGEDAGHAVDVLRAEHGKQLGELREDVVEIKTQMQHTPTKEDLAELEGTVKQINERTVQMAASASSTNATVTRIETYLLNNK